MTYPEPGTELDLQAGPVLGMFLVGYSPLGASKPHVSAGAGGAAEHFLGGNLCLLDTLGGLSSLFMQPWYPRTPAKGQGHPGLKLLLGYKRYPKP